MSKIAMGMAEELGILAQRIAEVAEFEECMLRLCALTGLNRDELWSDLREWLLARATSWRTAMGFLLNEAYAGHPMPWQIDAEEYDGQNCDGNENA